MICVEVYQHSASHGVITFKLLYRMLNKITNGTPGIPVAARIMLVKFDDKGEVTYEGNPIDPTDTTLVPPAMYMVIQRGEVHG